MLEQEINDTYVRVRAGVVFSFKRPIRMDLYKGSYEGQGVVIILPQLPYSERTPGEVAFKDKCDMIHESSALI